MYIKAAFLLLVWVTFALLSTKLFTPRGKKAIGFSWYQIFKNWLTPKRPRFLCGYHLASEDRPGLSAIVESTKCDECFRNFEASVK